MSEFHVPGFDVVELLGYGAGGEVWLAREHATGTPVALKRLRAGADLAARDRLRREAAVLAGVDHPHVLRLRSVVGAGEALVLVLDLATGGSLARLLATRGRLSAGEVVTVAVPLAQALADVHSLGLVHGDVTPANVLFTADGRPVLSDLGVSRLLGSAAVETAATAGFADPSVVAGADPVPATDVHGLAATCVAALTGSAPYAGDGLRVPPPRDVGPLMEVLERALVPDPAARPGAAELACALWDAAPAAPVRLVGAATDGVPAAGLHTGEELVPVTHRVHGAPVPGPAGTDPAVDRGRPGGLRIGRQGADRRAGGQGADRHPPARWRTVLALALAGTALAMAAVTGIAWAAADDDDRAAGVRQAATRPDGAPPPQPAAPPSHRGPSHQPPPQPPSRTPSGTRSQPRSGWATVLAGLDTARSAAFASGGPNMLTEVYVDGSPALRRDRAALTRMASSGLRAEGLRLDSVHVAVLGRDRGRVLLRVVDVMPAYRLVDGSGSVVERRGGRGEMRWTVALRRAGGQWRVYDVARG